MNALFRWVSSAWFWLMIIGLGIVMEVVAWYYQYVLEQPPCVLCIHVRIWVLALILASFLALMLRRTYIAFLGAQLLACIAAFGFLERSWQTLATEYGWISSGSCGLSAGLPDWFALDKWFPAFFKPLESCGYTPEMLFGITMAQALLALSVGIAVLLTFGLLATLLRQQ